MLCCMVCGALLGLYPDAGSKPVTFLFQKLTLGRSCQVNPIYSVGNNLCDLFGFSRQRLFTNFLGFGYHCWRPMMVDQFTVLKLHQFITLSCFGWCHRLPPSLLVVFGSLFETLLDCSADARIIAFMDYSKRTKLTHQVAGTTPLSENERSKRRHWQMQNNQTMISTTGATGRAWQRFPKLRKCGDKKPARLPTNKAVASEAWRWWT